jgi:uncharacterized protein
MPPTTLAVDRDTLAGICRKHGIRRLAVFGSALRGELRPDSDLDVLVEFEEGRAAGFRFITIQDELSALFGRRVDLSTPGFLCPHFRDRVVREALPLYQAA